MSKIAGDINAEMMKKSIHDSRAKLFAEIVGKTGSQQSVIDCAMQEIESLRQQLAAAQEDAKHAWEKAGEACTAHAASIKRELMLLEFVQKIKKQTPEKPDYWTPCGQCERNSSEAEDVLAATEPTSGGAS